MAWTRTRLRFPQLRTHTDHWKECGPGAGGMGWEMVCLGLALYIARSDQPKLGREQHSYLFSLWCHALENRVQPTQVRLRLARRSLDVIFTRGDLLVCHFFRHEPRHTHFRSSVDRRRCPRETRMESGYLNCPMRSQSNRCEQGPRTHQPPCRSSEATCIDQSCWHRGSGSRQH